MPFYFCGLESTHAYLCDLLLILQNSPGRLGEMIESGVAFQDLRQRSNSRQLQKELIFRIKQKMKIQYQL